MNRYNDQICPGCIQIRTRLTQIATTIRSAANYVFTRIWTILGDVNSRLRVRRVIGFATTKAGRGSKLMGDSVVREIRWGNALSVLSDRPASTKHTHSGYGRNFIVCQDVPKPSTKVARSGIKVQKQGRIRCLLAGNPHEIKCLETGRDGHFSRGDQ
jgi:hypothetical protein